MDLFQTARKEVMTIRNCRSAFRATGIYPYNPELVLKALPQQGTHSALISESEVQVDSPVGNSHRGGTAAIAQDSNMENPSKATTFDFTKIPSSLRRFRTTPHNTSTVQSHVVNILDQLTELEVDGVSIDTPIRSRVLQLGKSAQMSMARESIQLETNRQLRQKTRKKNSGSLKSGTGPGGRSAITDKGTRVLTIAEAQERKQKAEEKMVAGLQKQERLEQKRQDKALHEAMLSSPIGPLYEALAAAEEGESHVFLDLTAGWWIECLKSDPFLASSSISSCREEDYRAMPVPKLLKDRKQRGLIAPSKAQGTWEWVPAEDEIAWAFVHISFP